MEAPISSPAHNTRGSSSSSFSSASSSSHQSPSSAAAALPAPRAANTPSTDAFLKDFTLVAEAAKRAQVAVMVRDFEDCAL